MKSTRATVQRDCLLAFQAKANSPSLCVLIQGIVDVL